MPEPVSGDAFAGSLDAMARGARPDPDTDSLTQFARRLQAATAVTLSPAERASVWDRLMADRTEAADRASSVPPNAGGAASEVPLPPRDRSNRQRRANPRALHVMSGSGSWMTASLLVAVVALVGAMFANLDDNHGFVPAASATEGAPASPVASPQASPAVACDPVPVHAGGEGPEWVRDPDLREFPWFAADPVTGDVEIVGIQWYGDRTLTVGGVFASDGMSAKLVWAASEMLRVFEVSAIPVENPGIDPVAILAMPITGPAGGALWTSSLDLPSAGCWTLTITAETVVGGDPVMATAMLLVVEE
jgi:hypothetical protein